jgi:hypothetical protein
MERSIPSYVEELFVRDISSPQLFFSVLDEFNK